MRLLRFLKQHTADNCLILTYNLDLPFFEYALFDPLYAAGCRNMLVFCDPDQYQTALRDAPLLRYAGQRYLLVPGRTSPAGAFHPKVILLTSDTSGMVCIASSNLTKAGYTHNLEVVSVFEYDSASPDPASWQACNWAFSTFLEIARASDPTGLSLERLEQLRGTTTWLRQEPKEDLKPVTWTLHNLQRPLLDQFLDLYRARDGSAVSELLIISPFFDVATRAVARLVRELEPGDLRICTRPSGSGLSQHSLDAVLKSHPMDLRVEQWTADSRPLHAKVLLMRTEQGCWLASGSANLSAPAWLAAAANGNTECVCVRYEQDPAHFDEWVEDMLNQAEPLTLDPDATLAKEPKSPVQVPQVQILMAILRDGRLELRLDQPIATGYPVLLHIGDLPAISFDTWQQESDRRLTLPLPNEHLRSFDSPTVVFLEILSKAGSLKSNSMLVHNTRTLYHHSRPVDRRQRPRIPDGIKPESYEHCAELLDMLHDLLATNREQLRRHQARSTDRKGGEQPTEEPTGDEPYSPDDHFVDEDVRLAKSGTGADLYADYYERLTYEGLIRAALAAVYRPTSGREDRPGQEPTPADVPPPPQKLPPGDTGNETIRAKLRARIESGFNRLVSNFVQGLQDQEYLKEMPLRNLLELFVIITAYLRVVWRDGWLDDSPFSRHSLELLQAFWGRPGQENAWRGLHESVSDEMLRQEGERMALGAQTWLHAYAVALLWENGDTRLYELAAWMRHFATKYVVPDSVALLSADIYKRLWQGSLPSDCEFQQASAVVGRLHDGSQWYNEKSLIDAISSVPGSRAEIATDKITDTVIPVLKASMPFSDKTPDTCLRFFALFVRWPHPKDSAWARFTNTNPPEHPDDPRSVKFFYRKESASLVYAIERANDKHRPEDELRGVTLEALCESSSIAELYKRAAR